MKSGVKDFKRWLQENRQTLGPNADKNSKQYKDAVKEYKQRLEDTAGKIEAYLDKKGRDFERNPNRRDDPGNQKWEQLRIRSALHGYDSLRVLCRASR